jgi:hypothetical protein
VIRYRSTADVAAWFGVEARTVVKWRSRYEDFPPPDAQIGDVVGWLPEREQEIRRWEASRPGQDWRRRT